MFSKLSHCENGLKGFNQVSVYFNPVSVITVVAIMESFRFYSEHPYEYCNLAAIDWSHSYGIAVESSLPKHVLASAERKKPSRQEHTKEPGRF